MIRSRQHPLLYHTGKKLYCHVTFLDHGLVSPNNSQTNHLLSTTESALAFKVHHTFLTIVLDIVLLVLERHFTVLVSHPYRNTWSVPGGELCPDSPTVIKSKIEKAGQVKHQHE